MLSGGWSVRAHRRAYAPFWTDSARTTFRVFGCTRSRFRSNRVRRSARSRIAFFGSALKGDGVDELMAALPAFLPAESGDDDGQLSGTVFKIERGDDGQKVGFVRLFAGEVRARQRIGDEKVTALAGFEGGKVVQRDSVAAGEIAKIWGLRGIRIGDPIGEAHASARTQFPPPTLETAVRPAHEEDKAARQLTRRLLAGFVIAILAFLVLDVILASHPKIQLFAISLVVGTLAAAVLIARAKRRR